jgi:pSer/pThr/pTyr-binding forkhead associated (FHA) protein
MAYRFGHAVGRDPDAALWIDHATVSRKHACITIADGKATLEDLDSKNGTHLNGKKIARRTPLSDGDGIRVGPETMVFRTSTPGTTRTERRA